jgi:hypothetical protein
MACAICQVTVEHQLWSASKQSSHRYDGRSKGDSMFVAQLCILHAAVCFAYCMVGSDWVGLPVDCRGKRRMTNDFASVVYRIKLLGFNAIRVQFK